MATPRGDNPSAVHFPRGILFLEAFREASQGRQITSALHRDELFKDFPSVQGRGRDLQPVRVRL